MGGWGELKSVGKAKLHRCYTEVMGSIKGEFGGWIRRVAERHGYRIVPAASDLEAILLARVDWTCRVGVKA